jgi:hypothetical protein
MATSNRGKAKLGKVYPHTWLSGPDEFKHEMYLPWLRSKAQANYRKEEWDLSFEEFYLIWKEQWHNRGRKIDNVCMSRDDMDGVWDKNNIIIITRHEHIKRTGAHRKATGFKLTNTRGPDKKPRKPKGAKNA